MKLPPRRHRWDLAPVSAIRLQRQLAGEVCQTPLARSPRWVAGGDVSFSKDGRRLVAGWVVWDLKKCVVVESASDVREVTFPYIPGLLSFREAPALLGAARGIKTEPDAFMLDGQGLAHPRRFGLACHVGLLLQRPSCGCAKSRLCGDYTEPGKNRGASRRLLIGKELVGRVVRTRSGVKPVFVSIGHLITLDDAVKLALRSSGTYRIPEPTRRAHQLVTDLRHRL